MRPLVLFLIFAATGIAFSFAFILCGKIKCTRITRFAMDFILSVLFCLCVYAPQFFFTDGIIKPYSVIAAAGGFILPRIFIKRQKEI